MVTAPKERLLRNERLRAYERLLQRVVRDVREVQIDAGRGVPEPSRGTHLHVICRLFSRPKAGYPAPSLSDGLAQVLGDPDHRPGVAPELLKRIVVALAGQEEVDDDAAIVHQHPT